MLNEGVEGLAWRGSERSHMWMRLWSTGEAEELVGIKVRAHRPWDEVKHDAALRMHWLGNRLADRHAKYGSKLHPQAVGLEGRLSECEGHCKTVWRFMRWQAATMASEDEWKDCQVQQTRNVERTLDSDKEPRKLARKRMPWLAPEWVKELAELAPKPPQAVICTTMVQGSRVEGEQNGVPTHR
eukprot:6463015-Amphidinium_carterae.1